jgi:hypothetical protein
MDQGHAVEWLTIDRQFPGTTLAAWSRTVHFRSRLFFLVLLQFFEIKPVEKGLAFCSSRWLQLPQIHVQGEDVVKTSSEMLTWMCFVTMALESFASVMT